MRTRRYRGRRRPEVGKGADMPENAENTVEQGNATQGAPAEPAKTFTQAEMDAIIGERLKRERDKYADYEELKTKAAAYDEAAEAAKSDLERRWSVPRKPRPSFPKSRPRGSAPNRSRKPQPSTAWTPSFCPA